MKSDWVWLSHMRDCIELLEQFLGSHTTPMQIPMIRDAVLRNLQLIGQSSMKLADELKARHPEVRWTELRGLRNLLVHAYLDLNYPLVEQAIIDNLPELKQSVLAELAKYPPEGPFKQHP